MIHICIIGKFNTASRREANATVVGNSVYVTEENFKKFANYKNFWIFSNDSIDKEVNTAIKNAKRRMANYVDNRSKPSQYDPGTTVYRLAEELMRYLN